MSEMVHLQPIGHIDPEMLNFLMQSLSSLYSTKLLTPIEVPENAYDKTCGQSDRSGILEALPRTESLSSFYAITVQIKRQEQYRLGEAN